MDAKKVASALDELREYVETTEDPTNYFYENILWPNIIEAVEESLDVLDWIVEDIDGIEESYEDFRDDLEEEIYSSLFETGDGGAMAFKNSGAQFRAMGAKGFIKGKKKGKTKIDKDGDPKEVDKWQKKYRGKRAKLAKSAEKLVKSKGPKGKKASKKKIPRGKGSDIPQPR